MTGSIFQELKRRNVFRVAIVYIVVSWLLMQIGDVMFPALRLPEWTPTLLVAFLLLGFPLVVIFAWAFELTPGGVVRTSEVPEGQSITADTGRKINHSIIGILALAVAFLLVKDVLLEDTESPPAATGVDRSIAVLPFKNQSATTENAEFFAGGLHDELLTLLSRLGELKVISRTSVERLDPELSIPEIGELLGVATVLEGQVQRAGDRLRINVQLIDTAEEGHLWANTYNSQLTAENVFDVQSDIARTIANALQAELSPDDVETLEAVPTTNTAALEKYLLAMQVAKRRSFDALWQAEAYLVEVTSMDPAFVDAWTGLALVRGELFMTGAISVQRYVDEAGAAAAQALALSPRNAVALAEQARVLSASGDLRGAEAAFSTALEIAPQSSDVRDTYGEWLRLQGRLEAAREVLAGGLEFDPLSPALLFQLGRVEMYLGNPEGNIAVGERLLEIDPALVYGYVALLQANLWRGRFDDAWPWYVKTIATDPGDFETWAHLALFLDEAGAPELSDRYMERAESLDATSPVVVKCKSMVLVNRGMAAEATALAERMLTAGFDNRWESDRVLLRVIRDAYIREDRVDDVIALYRERKPGLFEESPDINSGNLNTAADLALALQLAGSEGRASRVLEAAGRWYDDTQPAGVYGYIHGLAKAELQAVAGKEDAAMATLQDAIDKGYRWQWAWTIGSPNFDALRQRPDFQEMTVRVERDFAAQLERILASPHLGDFDLRDPPTK